MMTLTAGLSEKFAGGFQLGACDLEIHPAETLGVVGKNGSGKSTLFNLLTANRDLAEGTLTLNEQRFTPEAHALKRQLGYLPQHHDFPPWVTGHELLSYASGFYGLSASTVEGSAQYWDCASYRHHPLTLCSHGMQKRVGLAVATIHSPPLLFLDEPFSGLDILHTKALENLLLARKKQKQSTVISTHILPYVAKICDRVLVLKDGHITVLQRWAESDYLARIAALETAVFE